MTKTVCDICGKEMSTTKSVISIKDLNFCISSYGKMWDICNECRQNLNRWMAICRATGGKDLIIDIPKGFYEYCKEQKGAVKIQVAINDSIPLDIFDIFRK